jgi:hypothetical protein
LLLLLPVFRAALRGISILSPGEIRLIDVIQESSTNGLLKYTSEPTFGRSKPRFEGFRQVKVCLWLRLALAACM